MFTSLLSPKDCFKKLVGVNMLFLIAAPIVVALAIVGVLFLTIANARNCPEQGMSVVDVRGLVACFIASVILASFVSVVLFVANVRRWRAARIVCRDLPGYDSRLENLLKTMNKDQLLSLAKQIKALQATGCGHDVANSLKEKLGRVFDSSKILGLLEEEMSERGYKTLFNEPDLL